MRKKIYNAIRAIVVEIDGEKVEIPFSDWDLCVIAGECECCGPHTFVAFEFSHKGKSYEAILRDD